MKLTFNQYIAKFHPDPDAIIIQDKNNSIGYEVYQITKLAENYANYRLNEKIRELFINE